MSQCHRKTWVGLTYTAGIVCTIIGCRYGQLCAHEFCVDDGTHNMIILGMGNVPIMYLHHNKFLIPTVMYSYCNFIYIFKQFFIVELQYHGSKVLPVCDNIL